jgi:hypothetical protein
MITIGGHKVYENLPTTGMVDLDKHQITRNTRVCSVSSWSVAEENPDMIDDVVSSGCIVLCDTGNGTENKIYWGKTKVNPQGFCDVVVDVPAITKDILLALYAMNVLPR